MEDKQPFEKTFVVTKLDPERQMVFGWFSVIEEGDKPVVDKQGDIIAEKDLEAAAYHFVLNARCAGEMHSRKDGVGNLVESIVFTKETQKALGIDLGRVGGFGGFHISDAEVWQAVKAGKYAAFSWGGRARAEEM